MASATQHKKWPCCIKGTCAENVLVHACTPLSKSQLLPVKLVQSQNASPRLVLLLKTSLANADDHST